MPLPHEQNGSSGVTPFKQVGYEKRFSVEILSEGL